MTHKLVDNVYHQLQIYMTNNNKDVQWKKRVLNASSKQQQQNEQIPPNNSAKSKNSKLSGKNNHNIHHNNPSLLLAVIIVKSNRTSVFRSLPEIFPSLPLALSLTKSIEKSPKIARKEKNRDTLGNH